MRLLDRINGLSFIGGLLPNRYFSTENALLRAEGKNV
jgi:hypothetical protein